MLKGRPRPARIVVFRPPTFTGLLSEKEMQILDRIQGHSVDKKMAQPHEQFRFLKNKKMEPKLSIELS